MTDVSQETLQQRVAVAIRDASHGADGVLPLPVHTDRAFDDDQRPMCATCVQAAEDALEVVRQAIAALPTKEPDLEGDGPRYLLMGAPFDADTFKRDVLVALGERNG